MTEFKSATNLENAFAQLLKKSAREVVKVFEFSDEGNMIIVHQLPDAYIERQDWLEIYRVCREAGGQSVKDEKTGHWFFRFPKAAAPSAQDINEAPKQQPGHGEEAAAGKPINVLSVQKTSSPSPKETNDTTALANISKVQQALSESKDLNEVVKIRDMAVAAQAWASARGADEAAQMALVVKLRAERKAGEFLKEMKEQGQIREGRPEKLSQLGTVSTTIKSLGLDRHESERWQLLASIPQEKFEDYLSKANRITQSALLFAAKKTENLVKSFITPNLPLGVFDVIYADPPWQYDFSCTNSREIVQQYPTMDLEDICNLKIPCADDAILFLWATAPKLEESLQVMNAWGFTYRTGMVWVKDRIGMGHLVRIQHEHLLIGKKGNFPAPNDQVLAGSVFSAPRQGHSEKPTAVYEIIEKYYPNGKRIELFARHKREGWEAWGNEIE